MKTKGNIQDIYPLTPMQEGMLLHSVMEEHSTAYFEQAAFRFQGDFEPSLIEQSLDVLFERHDILRTAFVYQGRQKPLQVVLTTRKCAFRYEDLSTMEDKHAQQVYLEKFKIDDVNQSFDLTKDVLMRVAVFYLGEREFEFVWSHHHILMDGWCTGIIFSEFFEIYNSLKENRRANLGRAIPFRYYIEWLEKQDRKRSQQYWKDYLSHYDELSEAPGRIQRYGQASGYKKRMLPHHLDPAYIKLLHQFVRDHRITMNIFVQTIWGLTLSKFSGRNDVIFGSVVSGRPGEIPGIESMLGLFINTVPRRIQFDDSMTVGELLRKVQDEHIEGEAHHYFPLADIQALSPLKQNLFDHIVSFDSYPTRNKKENQDTRIMAIESFAHTSFDLSVKVFPDVKFMVRLDFNELAIDRRVMTQVGEQMMATIHQVLTGGEIEIGNLEIIGRNQQKKVLIDDFNQPLE